MHLLKLPRDVVYRNQYILDSLQKFEVAAREFKGTRLPAPPNFEPCTVYVEQGLKLSFFFREPNCILESYLNVVSIETSTSLDTLQEFEGATREFGSQAAPPNFRAL